MYDKLSIPAKFLVRAIESRDFGVISSNWTGYLERLINGGAVESALLFVFAKYGEVDKLNELCLRGANVDIADSENATPLFHAIAHGQSDAVDLLLNKFHADIFWKKNNGETAFHVAARNRNSNCLKTLLDKIKRIKDLNLLEWIDCPSHTGITPLLKAAEARMEENVKLLVAEHVNVNQTHPELIGALYQMTLGSCVTGVAFLLQHGAKAHLGDNLGDARSLQSILLSNKIDADNRMKIIMVLRQELADLQAQAKGLETIFDTKIALYTILALALAIITGVLFSLCLTLFNIFAGQLSINHAWFDWAQNPGILLCTLIVSCVELCFLLPLSVFAVYHQLEEFVEILLGRETITSFSAEVQESYQILLKLIESGELHSIELLELLNNLTKDSNVNDIVLAFKELEQLGPCLIPFGLKDDISSYATHFDKARIRFFPPPSREGRKADDHEVRRLLDDDEEGRRERGIVSAAAMPTPSRT